MKPKKQPNGAKKLPFVREPRYLVIKISDLTRLRPDTVERLDAILDLIRERRDAAGKPPLNCVVVESDWPEFEPTWKAIEARMSGLPTKRAALAKKKWEGLSYGEKVRQMKQAFRNQFLCFTMPENEAVLDMGIRRILAITGEPNP